MPGRIVLVGFMGAGKSSVGRVLASRLGRDFIETDDMIAAREGRSIPEIFAERGEAYFRELEAEAVRLLALERDAVIATGGGLPCREGRMEALRALGTVVWLAGDLDALRERAARTGGRPMLAGRSREDVAALYAAREPYYRQAHLTVDTTGRSTGEVAAEIARALGLAGGGTADDAARPPGRAGARARRP